MPGWSALGGQTQSAYTIGDVDLTDGSMGQSVDIFLYLISGID
jgi:amidase